MENNVKLSIYLFCLLFCFGNIASGRSNDLPLTRQKETTNELSDKINKVKFINNRTDNDLVATYGTCYLNDFRFFTMLHQDNWDCLRWESMGNAVLAHRTWRNWPFEQHLSMQIDGNKINQDAICVDSIEQQFDFRQVSLTSSSIKLKRLDLMVSARHWMTALQIKNTGKKSSKVKLSFEWNEKNHSPLNIRPWKDGESQGFAYSVTNSPATIVSLGSNGTWDNKGDSVAVNSWELDVKAGKTITVNLDVYIGWGTLAEYRDKGEGDIVSDEQATRDRYSDRNGFLKLLKQNKISSFDASWENLQQICEVRRNYLYGKMPRLVNFDSAWDGMWNYTFDLIRSGIYPAQGNFKDVWKVESLDVYREPFYWDGPASIHTFCNWDADLAARTLLTYLTTTTEAGQLAVSANPYRVFSNPTPQLANITMALWDCYQITHDERLLEYCYPLLVKHVRWIEQKRNKTPQGPLMDIGYNIDYGPQDLYSTPTIWPDVQFFLVDRYRKLGKIARVINRSQEEIKEWENRSDCLTDSIRSYMWDDIDGTFWCLSDKMEYKKVPSPIEFHGMVAGIPTADQAKRLLNRLKDTTKYAPSGTYPYGLPSAPFDSPYFVVTDSWSGTIWPIQTYYTVRGLVNYGFQKEALALTKNIYGMMASDYAKSGSIWEQYDPRTGKNLSDGFTGNGTPEAGRGYFTSGITTSVIDLLLRGYWGFERTDNVGEFYLTPIELSNSWQGIDNIQLNKDFCVSISAKKNKNKELIKLRFTGKLPNNKTISIMEVNEANKVHLLQRKVKLDKNNELVVEFEKKDGIRYLWKLI